MYSDLFINIVIVAVTAHGSYSAPASTQDMNLMKQIIQWFEDVKEHSVVSQTKFNAGVKNATLIHRTFDENIVSYKENNTIAVKEWIDENCVKCEAEKYDAKSADNCFKVDENIRQKKTVFYSYMACVYNTISEYKMLNEEIGERYKNITKQYTELTQREAETISSKELQRLIYEATALMEETSDFKNRQDMLLNNLRMGSIYNEYEYFDENNNITVTDARENLHFAVQCYESNPYDYLSDEYFVTFRQCVVRKTCNKIAAEHYNSI